MNVRSYSVMVITKDFESLNLGSIPSRNNENEFDEEKKTKVCFFFLGCP